METKVHEERKREGEGNRLKKVKNEKKFKSKRKKSLKCPRNKKKSK